MEFYKYFSPLTISCLAMVGGCVNSQDDRQDNGLKKSEKPNIIWLMAEDMALDLECYSARGVSTPNLNKLANDGVKYNHCYSTNPISSPNRSAMMTGMHQNIIDAHHHRSNRENPLPEPYYPITRYLRKAGYTCILGHDKVLNKGQKIDCNFRHEKTGKWDGDNHFGLFDKLGGFAPKDQPFFHQITLYVSHRGGWWNKIRNESTSPVNPDEIVLPPYIANDSVNRLDWARYLDQIEYMDNEVGMIMAELEEKGLAENTVVIFSGDNGRCNIRGKGYLYDPGLHVPLIVHWPEKIKGGEVSNRLVSTTDISASVLDIAGVELPDYMHAIPFIGKKCPEERKYVYSARDLWDEVLEKSRSITTKKYHYIKHYKPEIPYDAHHAYLEFYRPAVHISRKLMKQNKLTALQATFFAGPKPREELYDKINDPYETTNLASNPTFQEELNQMKVYMKDWQKKYHDHGLDSIDWERISHPVSVDVLEWVKKERPEIYQQMQSGKEITFSEMARAYREAK